MFFQEEKRRKEDSVSVDGGGGILTSPTRNKPSLDSSLSKQTTCWLSQSNWENVSNDYVIDSNEEVRPETSE